MRATHLLLMSEILQHLRYADYCNIQACANFGHCKVFLHQEYHGPFPVPVARRRAVFIEMARVAKGRLLH